MAKSSSKRRPRTSAQSAPKKARPATAVARRAATSRAKTSKPSKIASSRGAKRPKSTSKTTARTKVTAKATARTKAAAKASAPKRRLASSSAKSKGRKITKAVTAAKKRPAARTTTRKTTPRPRAKTAKQPVSPKAAAKVVKRPRSPERPPLAPSIPSSLAYDTSATSARSGAEEMRSNRAKHTDTSPALTGGDIDASWEEASSSGDELPGGDNLTPDQDVVEEIGSALGIEYADDEELQGGVELEKRDRHRWEYDPASADDYIDRLKNES